MTGKEKTFFRMCIKLVLCGQWTVKEVMDLVQDMISYDECIVYLRSWEQLGFFSSTWTSYTGWFSGNLYSPIFKHLLTSTILSQTVYISYICICTKLFQTLNNQYIHSQAPIVPTRDDNQDTCAS